MLHALSRWMSYEDVELCIAAVVPVEQRHDVDFVCGQAVSGTFDDVYCLSDVTGQLKCVVWLVRDNFCCIRRRRSWMRLNVIQSRVCRLKTRICCFLFFARQQLYRQVLLRARISYGDSVRPSVCLSRVSRPGTESSLGEIESPGFHRMIAQSL